jgi:hypothetical protein
LTYCQKDVIIDPMTNKGTKMTEFEQNCYGMSVDDIRDEYMHSLTGKLSGQEMVVMSILSDAQELMAMGRTESARKLMNIAKFILGEMMDAKESV